MKEGSIPLFTRIVQRYLIRNAKTHAAAAFDGPGHYQFEIFFSKDVTIRDTFDVKSSSSGPDVWVIVLVVVILALVYYFIFYKKGKEISSLSQKDAQSSV